ncbi:hypothetical protein WG906_08770 [Pedobacter sp. P351]|uniref:hypothetical protein n=1 Tax=Pedobacter superstes TaxID=3133441 RepID=UPI0030B1FC69
MFAWVIIIIVVGAVIGFMIKGKEGAAVGAVGGFAIIFEIAMVVLPIILLIAMIRSCS